MLLGESFDAEQAKQWGLVRAVVPVDEVLGAALELARRLAAGPTAAYTEIKRALALGAVSPLDAVLATRCRPVQARADPRPSGCAVRPSWPSSDRASRGMTAAESVSPSAAGRWPPGRRWLDRPGRLGRRPTRRTRAGDGTAAGCTTRIAAGGRGHRVQQRGYDATSMEDCPAPRDHQVVVLTTTSRQGGAPARRAGPGAGRAVRHPRRTRRARGTPLQRLQTHRVPPGRVLTSECHTSRCCCGWGTPGTERWALARRREFRRQHRDPGDRRARRRADPPGHRARAGCPPALGTVNSLIRVVPPRPGRRQDPAADVVRVVPKASSPSLTGHPTPDPGHTPAHGRPGTPAAPGVPVHGASLAHRAALAHTVRPARRGAAPGAPTVRPAHQAPAHTRNPAPADTGAERTSRTYRGSRARPEGRARSVFRAWCRARTTQVRGDGVAAVAHLVWAADRLVPAYSRALSRASGWPYTLRAPPAAS